MTALIAVSLIALAAGMALMAWLAAERDASHEVSPEGRAQARAREALERVYDDGYRQGAADQRALDCEVRGG